MKILNEYPPNIEEIDKALASKSKKGVLYAYGETIYNPDGVDIPVWLIEHEKVHFQQQGGHPEFWWQNYLDDPQFRFGQELEAHKKEYQVFCDSRESSGLYHTRAQRRMYLKSICKRLSGPLYGNISNEKKVKELIIV